MPDIASAFLELATHGGKLALEHVAHRLRRKEERQEQAVPAFKPLPLQELRPLEPLAVLSPLTAQPLAGAAPAPASEPAGDAGRQEGAAPSYAEEFGMDDASPVACWPCTRRHLNTALVAAEDGAKAKSPEERQAATATVLGEVAVWQRYDITAEKLANTSPDRRRAVEAAMPGMLAAAGELPAPPGNLALAWSAAVEAFRFANSSAATLAGETTLEKRREAAMERREADLRMEDVQGWVGYLDTLPLGPDAAPHLRAIRAARHRLNREGNTPEAIAQMRDALRAAAVALTPDPGAEAMERAAGHLRRAREAFYGGALGAMKARKAAGAKPAADVERISLSGAYFDLETRPPERLARAYLVDREEPDPLGSTPETRQAFENLARFDAMRNVPVRAEPLPSFFDEQGQWEAILGAYFPDGDHIYVGPQATVEAPKDLYTVAEETAHSLLHNTRCNIYRSKGVPYEDMPEEKEAKTAAMLALLDAGMPLETDAGRRIDPRKVRADVRAMERDMGPTMLRRVQWAAGILQRAIRGDMQGAAAESGACP